MRSFFILIVLFNKRLDESKSLYTLLPLVNFLNDNKFEVNLIVWNNSANDFDIGALDGIKIMGDGANHPLPKIYNCIAELVLSYSDKFLLMIADDDTDFTDLSPSSIVPFLYQDEIANYAILLPKIFSSNVLVSPARRLWFKGVRLESVASGELVSKNLLAINSGMILFSECLEVMKPFFDERLFYYGTDTDFMVRYEKYFSHVYVLPNRIAHSLSEHALESIERTLFRWNDHFYSMRITFGTDYLSRFLISIYITYRKLKLALRYKCLTFLK